jgi:hypothetical protein
MHSLPSKTHRQTLAHKTHHSNYLPCTEFLIRIFPMNKYQLEILYRYWRICLERANRYSFHLDPNHESIMFWQRKTVKVWKLYQHYARIYERDHRIHRGNTSVRVQMPQGGQKEINHDK